MDAQTKSFKPLSTRFGTDLSNYFLFLETNVKEIQLENSEDVFISDYDQNNLLRQAFCYNRR